MTIVGMHTCFSVDAGAASELCCGSSLLWLVVLTDILPRDKPLEVKRCRVECLLIAPPDSPQLDPLRDQSGQSLRLYSYLARGFGTNPPHHVLTLLCGGPVI